MSLTVADIANQIKNANDLGRKNLEYHGIYLDDTVSTYDIMSAIEKIEGGRMLPMARAEFAMGAIVPFVNVPEQISTPKNTTVEITVNIA